MRNAAKSYHTAAQHHGKGEHQRGGERSTQSPTTFPDRWPTLGEQAHSESTAKVSSGIRKIWWAALALAFFSPTIFFAYGAPNL
jgi:hypothetical protein